MEASLASSNPAPTAKRKRGLPGNPDPDAEVMVLSPKTLMATDRFMCEICKKGFKREQNLQLHRRGHNLPWKLKQRSLEEERKMKKKKVYVCPEISCVHHDPSRALGDLTGIKKHFSRKHGEKKWKCEKCSKKYAVQSDWKAHTKICGTREYKCHCGTLFSRRDSFITHRAFCDALAEESARVIAVPTHHELISTDLNTNTTINLQTHFPAEIITRSTDQHQSSMNGINNSSWSADQIITDSRDYLNPPFHGSSSLLSAQLSATALLQKAAQMGATANTIAATMTVPHSITADHDQTSTATGFGTGISSNLVLPNSSSLVQEMMSAVVPPDHGSLGDMNSTAMESFQLGRSHERSDHNNNGDGLTRDFLGIRPFSHKDILSMAGISSCLNPHEHTPQNGEPNWLG